MRPAHQILAQISLDPRKDIPRDFIGHWCAITDATTWGWLIFIGQNYLKMASLSQLTDFHINCLFIIKPLVVDQILVVDNLLVDTFCTNENFKLDLIYICQEQI